MDDRFVESAMAVQGRYYEFGLGLRVAAMLDEVAVAECWVRDALRPVAGSVRRNRAALLPSYLIDGRLEVATEDSTLTREVWMVFHRDLRNQSRLRKAIDWLETYFTDPA